MTACKIVNKSKDGVTLQAGPIKSKLSWDDFNEQWYISKDDKFEAIMKPEYEEKATKVSELVNDAVLAFLMGNGDKPELKLQSAFMFSKTLEEAQKIEPEMSPADFMKLVNIQLTKFTNDCLAHGIGFGGDIQNRFNSKQRYKNNRNKKRMEFDSAKQTNNDTDHYTIGDAIKAQQAKK